MCYGAHPNDFLFAECKKSSGPGQISPYTHFPNLPRRIDGFFLEENEWEVIYLDGIVFRILSPSDRDELRLQQYYGYDIFLISIHFFVFSFSCTGNIAEIIK